MKNPLKHLKHLWKDPITTIEEADARKKEILPWLIGSAVVAVASGILSDVLDTGILMVLCILGVFAVLAFGFMLWVTTAAKNRFRALTCNHCNTLATIKTPEDFAKYVSFEVVKNEATYSGLKHPASSNGVVAKVEANGSSAAKVLIDLKCPNCGKIKRLEYSFTPFKCHAEETRVAVRDVELVKMRLESAVKGAVEDYNDPEKRAKIPYSIHSSKHPQYENRTKPQFSSKHIPEYNGAKITYHKDPEEMVLHLFLENLLNGSLVDPSQPKKK